MHQDAAADEDIAAVSTTATISSGAVSQQQAAPDGLRNRVGTGDEMQAEIVHLTMAATMLYTQPSSGCRCRPVRSPASEGFASHDAERMTMISAESTKVVRIAPLTFSASCASKSATASPNYSLRLLASAMQDFVRELFHAFKHR